MSSDAAALRPEDSLFARDSGGLRWYRCLRCDSWLALSPPDRPTVEHPPPREEISLPLRGRPLRDRYILRLIAIDRVIHFLVLSALAAAIFLFASNKAALDTDFTKILNDLQKLFAVSITNLYLAGAAVAAYAVLEGTEAVGLWQGRRWAEYLTFVATVIFVPYEIYELTKTISALKVLALVINLAIVAYLLFAKRLFGLRGGGKAERAEQERDTGWAPLERATPRPSTPLAADFADRAGNREWRGDRSCTRLTTSATGATTTMEEDPARAARCHELIKQVGGSGQAGPAMH
jgi:uncharacterized membrane protein (DUF2068 family)